MQEQGAAGPGLAQGAARRGQAQGAVGQGQAQGAVGQGQAQGAAGRGLTQGAAGQGQAQGAAGRGQEAPGWGQGPLRQLYPPCRSSTSLLTSGPVRFFVVTVFGNARDVDVTSRASIAWLIWLVFRLSNLHDLK